jgi:hypothetical protein
MKSGKEIIDAFQRAKTIRMNGYDQRFNRIARYLAPQDEHFGDLNRQPGNHAREKIFYNKPSLLVEKYISVLDYLLTPAGTLWHGLTLENGDELADSPAVKDWFDQTRDVLFRYRYNTRSGFRGASLSGYADIGVFGNSCIFIDERPDGTPHYRAVPMYQVFIGEDWLGQPDTVYRHFPSTIRQLRQRFGEELLPSAVLSRGKQNAEETVEVVHCVIPNERYVVDSDRPEESQYTSHYVLLESQTLIETRPQYSMPYAVGQLRRRSGELYARGPGDVVLDDIAMLNRLSRDIIEGSARAAFPPILLHGKGAGSKFSMRNGALNWDMVSPEGRPLAQAMQGLTNPGTGIEVLEWFEGRLKEAFLLDLFEILVEKKNMSATEVLERKGEKSSFLSTGIGDLQLQLATMIEREIDILSRNGKLPQPPQELIDRFGGAVRFSISYDTELSRLQKAGQISAQQRWFQETMAYAQADQSVVQMVNFEELVKASHEGNMLPSKLLFEGEELEARRQAAAEQQQQQQLLEAAPAAAGAIRDLGQAGLIQ